MNNSINCKIGIHYHIPVFVEDNCIYTNGFFGVFLDSLANYSQHVSYFCYVTNNKHELNLDYEIKSKNVSIINVGKYYKNTVLRVITSYLKKNYIKSEIKNIDYLIIRVPTALTSLFYKVDAKIAVMLIGIYANRSQLNTLSLPSNIYNTILYIWMKYYEKRLLRKSLVLPNNDYLYRKSKKISKECIQIKTTNISKKNIYLRKDTCDNKITKLLFVGRFEKTKGLLELYEAIAQLKKEKIICQLSVVGWSSSNHFTEQLTLLSDKLQIADMISNLGYVPYGEPLYKIYRAHDMFILPTKQDAYPRTITEAMSQSLPVIATKVGGIPDRLTHEMNAILIDPGNVGQIVDAIIKLKNNPQLRMRLIQNGLDVALDNTLEEQTPRLISIIHNHFSGNDE